MHISGRSQKPRRNLPNPCRITMLRCLNRTVTTFSTKQAAAEMTVATSPSRLHIKSWCFVLDRRNPVLQRIINPNRRRSLPLPAPSLVTGSPITPVWGGAGGGTTPPALQSGGSPTKSRVFKFCSGHWLTRGSFTSAPHDREVVCGAVLVIPRFRSLGVNSQTGSYAGPDGGAARKGPRELLLRGLRLRRAAAGRPAAVPAAVPQDAVSTVWHLCGPLGPRRAREMRGGQKIR